MNILLTSVGRRTYLVKYFKEALGDNGKIFVANSDEKSPAFAVADGSVVTPLIYDNEYISFLLDYCKKQKIDVIISLFDIDLPVLSKAKNEFRKAGVNVIVSDYEFVKICNDKWLTYLFLKEKGFNTINTYLDINKALFDIESKIISFPLIVKPRWGMGSISIFIANDFEELNIFYKKIKNDVKNNYLKYESSQDFDNCVIIQEKIDGQEYGLDIFNDLNGKFVNAAIKKKISMRSGETDCAITENNKELYLLAKKISKCSKHIANLDTDVFLTDKGPYVLEMNARFGGGYPFSHIAGANLPKTIIMWLQNEKVPKDMLSVEYGILAQKDINIVRLQRFNNL